MSATVMAERPRADVGDVVLSIRNLESFYGPIMAIRGCSLDVHDGQIVTVLGANGAGKTTLLKTVSGVMDPEKGEVLYQGQNIAGASPDKVVRMGIVHVPEGREVFPLLTVAENLRMGAYTRNDIAGIAEDEEMVFSYFPILRERRNQAAGTLSGGQQQMLAIGRALMSRPKLLLLDEPSLGLAPIYIRRIFQIVRELNRDHGMTILLVEQNANQALRVAHRGYVLQHGEITLAGSGAELLASPEVRAAYLEGGHG
mgnify:CR=1 FL=1